MKRRSSLLPLSLALLLALMVGSLVPASQLTTAALADSRPDSLPLDYQPADTTITPPPVSVSPLNLVGTIAEVIFLIAL